MRRVEAVTSPEEAAAASSYYRRKWLSRHIAVQGCKKATIVERGGPASVEPEPGEILHILGPRGDDSPSAEIREGAGVGGLKHVEKAHEARAIFEKFTNVKFEALVNAIRDCMVVTDGRVLEDATYELTASSLQLPHGTTMLNRAAFREALKAARR